MDYRTKPTSRAELRTIATFIRKIFKCENEYYFDVIKAFDFFPILFPMVTTEIVPNDESDMNDIPSTIIPNMKGNYHIKIKEYVYDGAFFKKTGGYRNHIMHEMAHAILFLFGFDPHLDRAYRNNELMPYESIEWQAKALAGEVLMPYESTKGMTVEQIQELCKVSKAAAETRVKLDEEK